MSDIEPIDGGTVDPPEPPQDAPVAPPEPQPTAAVEGDIESNADAWDSARASVTQVVADRATTRHAFETAINTAVGVTPATNDSVWADAAAILTPGTD